MSVRGFLVALLFAITALAGCLGGGDDVDPDDDQSTTAFDEETGSVRGQVLNFDTQGPIRNAEITLISVGGDSAQVASNRTDDSGNYVLRQIPPGDYRLHVSSFCCEPEFKLIKIEANSQIEESFLLLPYPDLVPTGPYATQDDFVGFVNCGIMVSGATMVPCTHPALSSGDDQQKLIEHANIAPGLKTVSVAVTWDTPGFLGSDEMRLTVEDASSGTTLVSEVGTSPIEWQMHLSDFENPDNGWDVVHDGEGWTMAIVVRPAQVPSVVFQQTFHVFYDMHYWDPAPEGYTALPDM